MTRAEAESPAPFFRDPGRDRGRGSTPFYTAKELILEMAAEKYQATEGGLSELRMISANERIPLRNRWLCIPTLRGGESQLRVGELWGLVVFIVLPDWLPGSAPFWFGSTADCQSQRVGGLPFFFLLFVRARLPFLQDATARRPLPSIPCPFGTHRLPCPTN